MGIRYRLKMTIRKIKSKERKLAGNIYCDHCKPEKVDAVWRKKGITADHKQGDYACEKHKNLIKVFVENDDYSEADYQTWLRL